MKWMLVLCALLFPATTWADSVEMTPFAGWVWGGTQKFDFEVIRGDIHLNAAPEYGLSVGGYGRNYAAEIVYHYQGSDAVVRVDGLGELASFDASFHYIVLQLVRQYHWAGLIPFATVGLGGAGLYVVGSSDWEYVCSAGGGFRKPFPRGGSLRLTVRMLAPLEIAKNGFSFGAGNSGIVVGGTNKFFQGDVNLGYSFPLWRSR